MKFKYNADRIIVLLGAQNFETDNSAILEIIKNSYDANASEISIIFDDDSIDFIDDGIGMSKDNIESNWMTVGKSDKGYTDEDNSRVLAGDKGIGRLALARLGNKVEMYSKKKKNSGIYWNTNGWITAKLVELADYNETGTTIKVEQLASAWDDEKILELNIYLSKIVNHADDFNIYIVNKLNVNKIVYKIENIFDNVKLKNYLAKIKFEYTCLDKSISLSIEEEIFDDVEIKKVIPDYNNLIKDTIKIEAEDSRKNYTDGFGLRDLSSLESVGDFSGVIYWGKNNASEISRDRFKYRNTRYVKPNIVNPDTYEYIFKDSKYHRELNKLDGIILYRNAFSVSGYDGSRDWLEISRRVQKSPATETHPTGKYRVRNNNIYGKINIDKKDNHNLRDLSNRQGLEDNKEFKIMRKLIYKVLETFEKRYQTNARMLDYMYKGIRTESISSIIRKLDSKKELTIDDRKEAVKVFTIKSEENVNLKQDLSIHEAITTSVVKSLTITHDLNQATEHLRDKPNILINSLEDLLDSEALDNISPQDNPLFLAKSISKNCIKILNHYDDIVEVGTNITNNSIEEQNLDNFFSKFSVYWNNALESLEVNIDGLTSYEISINSLSSIFDNLVSNSINHNFPKKVNVIINIECEEDRINIKYSDDGIGLIGHYLKNPRLILDAFETSKRNGHGLGMWIIDSIVQRYGGKIKNINGKNGFKIDFYMLKEIEVENDNE